MTKQSTNTHQEPVYKSNLVRRLKILSLEKQPNSIANMVKYEQELTATNMWVNYCKGFKKAFHNDYPNTIFIYDTVKKRVIMEYDTINQDLYCLAVITNDYCWHYCNSPAEEVREVIQYLIFQQFQIVCKQLYDIVGASSISFTSYSDLMATIGRCHNTLILGDKKQEFWKSLSLK